MEDLLSSLELDDAEMPEEEEEEEEEKNCTMESKSAIPQPLSIISTRIVPVNR